MVMACKACKVLTRLALQEESRGSWSPTRRRAIQGKEFSCERVSGQMRETHLSLSSTDDPVVLGVATLASYITVQR